MPRVFVSKTYSFRQILLIFRAMYDYLRGLDYFQLVYLLVPYICLLEYLASVMERE